MKREFLEAMGLTKEQVDSIMNENGNDINNAKKAFADYDDIKSQLTAAQDTITTLKKDSKDVEKLQTKITEYENTITTMKTESETKAKTASLIEALKAEKLADPEYFIFKQGGLDKFSFGQDGKPIGVSDVVKPFKESNASWFQTEQKPGFEQIGGGSGSGNQNPPDMNAALASAFGVSEK